SFRGAPRLCRGVPSVWGVGGARSGPPMVSVWNARDIHFLDDDSPPILDDRHVELRRGLLVLVEPDRAAVDADVIALEQRLAHLGGVRRSRPLDRVGVEIDAVVPGLRVLVRLLTVALGLEGRHERLVAWRVERGRVADDERDALGGLARELDERVRDRAVRS